MSLTATNAITQAMQTVGRLFPGETPSTSELNQFLTLANQMLASWYNEQAQALEVLIDQQNKAGLALIAKQVEAMDPLNTSYVLAGATYTAPSYSAGTITGGSQPAFPDLTTSQTFPTGYDLAIVLGLAIQLLGYYGEPIPDSLMKNLSDARAQANPVPSIVPRPGTGMQGTVPAPGEEQAAGGA